MSGLEELIRIANSVEPAATIATAGHVARARLAVDELGEVDDDDRDDVFAALEHAAAVAIAAGDTQAAQHFLSTAERYADDDARRAEILAARAATGSFRALVHGRWLLGNDRESEATAVLTELKKTTPDAVLRDAAIAELAAPRPMGDGDLPMLSTWNGIGGGLYGRRDARKDGSYVATHCLCLLYVPLIPTRAYRVVATGDNSWLFLAREKLSTFAKVARAAVIGTVVLGIAIAAVAAYLHDPDKDLKQRFDRALAMEDDGDPEAALAALDAALDGGALYKVQDRAEKAGAAIVRLSASYVPEPFTRDALEPARRVVLRYRDLPDVAQGGVARTEMVGALERWIAALGAPDDLDARVVLLRDAAAISEDDAVAARLATARRELAGALSADYPLEALGVLVGQPRDPELVALARPIIDGLIESPSLVADAGEDIDAWLAAVPEDEPQRAQIETARALGLDAQTEAVAEGLTPAQLAKMQAARPWDQRVALRLAQDEIAAGKLAAAEQRLRAFGGPGRLIRDARLALAEIAAATGRLEHADELVTRLLRGRLQRFLDARASYETIEKDFWDRLDLRLRLGEIPSDLSAKLDSATPEQQDELLRAWGQEELEADEKVTAARARYFAYADVVQTSLTAGSVKLRRAQGLEGAARDAMLVEAERAFLAIRAEAEGEPGFHLGLGEVFARLGKTEESDAELQALLDRGDPSLSLDVASVYRGLGSVQRATAIATDVLEKNQGEIRDRAAILLSIMALTDDERETWLRKADQKHLYVKTALLEIDAMRAMRKGDLEQCASAYAKSARAHLEMANYNNAALAHQARFYCSGDVEALEDAEETLERAYRAQPDQPVIVGNLARLLTEIAELRVLARRFDVGALRPTSAEVSRIVSALVRGSERDAILAELAADKSARRSLELSAQEEILAPNSLEAYERRFDEANRRRDEAAAADGVARLRAAKGLDTSAAANVRARWRDGSMDEDYLEAIAGYLERLEPAAASKKLNARTRAVALYLAGDLHTGRAVVEKDAAEMAEGRKMLVEAIELWPALDSVQAIAHALVDEAGLTADPERWGDERRVRSAAAALAKLAAAGDPLADRIRASSQWAEVAAVMRADTTLPDLDDVRLAQLLGDAELIERTRSATTSPLTRLQLDVEEIVDPTSETLAEDRALLAP